MLRIRTLNVLLDSGSSLCALQMSWSGVLSEVKIAPLGKWWSVMPLFSDGLLDQGTTEYHSELSTVPVLPS